MLCCTLSNVVTNVRINCYHPNTHHRKCYQQQECLHCDPPSVPVVTVFASERCYRTPRRVACSVLCTSSRCFRAADTVRCSRQCSRQQPYEPTITGKLSHFPRRNVQSWEITAVYTALAGALVDSQGYRQRACSPVLTPHFSRSAPSCQVRASASTRSSVPVWVGVM
jgi:hypothetical protein